MAKATGRGHASVTTPRQGATRGCSNALGSFAASEEEEEEEGRSPPGVNGASWPRCRAWDPLCRPGSGVPPGRTPSVRSRKVRSTLGWQNVWSACSTLHENVGCYGNTALSIPVLGYLCSGEEGRACQSRTSSTQLAAFPFSTAARGSRGGHQRLAPPC